MLCSGSRTTTDNWNWTEFEEEQHGIEDEQQEGNRVVQTNIILGLE
jgi:hypothetical protein